MQSDIAVGSAVGNEIRSEVLILLLCQFLGKLELLLLPLALLLGRLRLLLLVGRVAEGLQLYAIGET